MNVIIPITYPDGFRAGVTAMYIVWLFGIFHAASAPLCVAPLGGERSRKPAFECVARPKLKCQKKASRKMGAFERIYY